MKMKLYIPMLALVGLFAGSCADRLELDPFSSIGVDNAFRTPTDFDNAVRGIYGALRGGNLYGGEIIAQPDILADNLIIASEGRLSYQTRHFWNFGGNNTWLMWDDGYRVINRANLVLENMGTLAEGDVRDNFEGQALALRALAHFEMARVFCMNPQSATGEDMGIPYMISSDASQKPARPALNATFDGIIADLEEALGLIGSSNGIYQLNEITVNALLARVHFYIGNNAEAITYATAVIDAAPQVATYGEFGDVWTDDSNTGVLMKVANTNQDNISPGVQYSQTGPDGVRSEYVVDYDFYLDYQAGDMDVRFDEYFSTSDFAGKTWNHIAKWFGRTGANANVSDIQVFRVEEMYLTRAEAYAATGQDGPALADLDEVRNERYASYIGGQTGAALLSAIQDERRKELAFEGHRLFDIKRMGIDIQRSTNGDESDGGGQALPANALLLEAGDFRFAMPIPQAELNANENMTQNRGY